MSEPLPLITFLPRRRPRVTQLQFWCLAVMLVAPPAGMLLGLALAHRL